MPRYTRKRRGGRKKMRGGRREYELHKAGKDLRELMCFTPRLNSAQEKQLLTTLRSIGDSVNVAETKANIETKKAVAATPAIPATSFPAVASATTPAKISMANATANATAATNNAKAAASNLQSAVQSTVKATLDNATNAATKLRDTVTNTVTDNLDKLKKGAQGAIVDAANKLKEMATPVSNAVAAAANKNNFAAAVGKIKAAAAAGDISKMNLAAQQANTVATRTISDAEKETKDSALAGMSGGSGKSRRRRRRVRRRTRRRVRRRMRTRRRRRRRRKRRRTRRR